MGSGLLEGEDTDAVSESIAELRSELFLGLPRGLRALHLSGAEEEKDRKGILKLLCLLPWPPPRGLYKVHIYVPTCTQKADGSNPNYNLLNTKRTLRNSIGTSSILKNKQKQLSSS